MCSKYDYILPSVSDPENNQFSLSILDKSLDWIQVLTMNNERHLIFDSRLLGQLTYSAVINVEIKIEDTTGAFMIYGLNVTILQYIEPYFKTIDNIIIFDTNNKPTYFFIDSHFNLALLNLKIKSVECNTNDELHWITAIVNESNGYLNFKLDNVSGGLYCARLVANFECKDSVRIQSNEFQIDIRKVVNHPPICTNIIPKIVMYYGQESKEVILPQNLFIDVDGDKLNYTSSGCIDSHTLNIISGIRSDSDISTLYVFIKQFKIGSCNITITATDPKDQTNTILVEVEILNCASKDCILCNGALQINCLKCIDGYLLETKSGACLEQIQYESFNLYSYFRFFGFATFLAILIPIFWFKYYGRIVLNPILYAQIFIAVVYVEGSVSMSMKSYFEWLQVFKLDFGFANLIARLNITMLCTPSKNVILKEIGMHCNGFVTNYIYLILVLILLFIIKRTLDYYSKALESIKITNYIRLALSQIFSSKLEWWCFHNILFIFPISCIAIDIINVKYYPINSFISIVALALIIIIIFMTKFECTSISLFVFDNRLQSSIFLYLHIARNILIVLIFCIESNSTNILPKIAFWCVQLSNTICIIILLRYTITKQLIICTIFELSICVWIPFYLFQHNLERKNYKNAENSTDSTFCLLIFTTFTICMIIILCPDTNFLKACCKKKLINKNK